MAKGLSNTQKTILKVIREMPEGSKMWEVTHRIKAVLYPDLYRNSKKWYYGSVINYGQDMNKKNAARVTMSRSVKRLVERKLLTICSDYCIRLTIAGKEVLTVNEVAILASH